MKSPPTSRVSFFGTGGPANQSYGAEFRVSKWSDPDITVIKVHFFDRRHIIRSDPDKNLAALMVESGSGYFLEGCSASGAATSHPGYATLLLMATKKKDPVARPPREGGGVVWGKGRATKKK